MLGLLAGLGGGAGLAAFYRALSLGTMSIVSPLAACGAVVPFAISIATGERPATLAVAGAVLALGGAVLASLEEHRSEVPERSRAIALALLAAVALGLFTYFLGLGSREGSPLSTLVGARVGSLALLARARASAGASRCGSAPVAARSPRSGSATLPRTRSLRSRAATAARARRGARRRSTRWSRSCLPTAARRAARRRSSSAGSGVALARRGARSRAADCSMLGGVESLAGRLLVSSPSLVDPNFRRTVVLMTHHDDEGAVGLVLSRPSELRIAEAVPDLGDLPCGRVSSTSAARCSRRRSSCSSSSSEPTRATSRSSATSPTCRPTASADELAAQRARVFAGYSGWGPGPARARARRAGLDRRRRAEPDDVFASDPDELWRTVLQRKGGEFALIATMPYDPGLN